MLPNPRKIKFKFKRPPAANGFPDSSFLGRQPTAKTQELVDISSSSSSSSSETEETNSDLSKQIVLYDPDINSNNNSNKNDDYDGGGDNTNRGAIVPVLEPTVSAHQRHLGFSFLNQQPSRPLPSVGAFTVQCASCFKWRLIPTKEKYEEIREHVLERPFYCETAREWRPQITCLDPADIDQDGSRLWAIDKPNIAQTPQGWQRLLRIRGEGSTKFADVYYVAPSGKRLRSSVEIEKYLLEHPEYKRDGLTMSQFSFRTPKPLQENYVRKRTRPLLPCDGNNRPLEPEFPRPLAWAGPDDATELQLGMPQLPPATPLPSVEPPAKRPLVMTPSTSMYSSDPSFNTDLSF